MTLQVIHTNPQINSYYDYVDIYYAYFGVIWYMQSGENGTILRFEVVQIQWIIQSE